MKLNQNQIDSLVRRVLLGVESKKLVTFNKNKEAILKQGREILLKDYEKETQLEHEVMGMLDQLEREQTDQFERHKMFKMLKKKVADEKGFVL